jgi:hypothetical protein
MDREEQGVRFLAAQADRAGKITQQIRRAAPSLAAGINSPRAS